MENIAGNPDDQYNLTKRNKMTPQEKIAKLCEEALVSDAPSESSIKPQPFLDTSDMPPEQVEALAKLGAIPTSETTRPQDSPAHAPKPSTDEVSKPENKVAHTSVNQADPEFGSMLEEREGRIKKRSKRAALAVNLLLLALVGGTATSFAVSPTLRGKAQNLVTSLKEGVDDVKMMGKGSENYDEALKEVAERGNQIEAATIAMGVDPSTVDPGDDPGMLAEMNELAGEDIGLDTRLGKLQSMGKIGQAITGAEGPKSKEELLAPDQEPTQ
jgi:hypothetical protein